MRSVVGFSLTAVILLAVVLTAGAGCGGGTTTGTDSSPGSNPTGAGQPKVIVFTSPG